MAATVSASSTEHTLCHDQKDKQNLTEFSPESLQYDNYNGVTLRLEQDDEYFSQRLASSLERWGSEGRRGVWIHLPTPLAHHVPICTNLGFDFHSAKPGMLILTKWLPADSESRLPHGPTHQVGVGTLVLNQAGEMLVVQEKTGPAAKFKLWKLPTGLLDPGEDVATAAIRELQEETGLEATLEKILCIRHATSSDRQSDLFFVCLLKLKDPTQIPRPQEDEIADIKWMSVDQFVHQDLWNGSPVYKELNRAMVYAATTRGAGWDVLELPVGFRPGSNTIYVPPSNSKL
jgi:ADP-ribose pyrophosphatase YjhB (NUDIX family)